MSGQVDPLQAKVQDLAETLNRRRRTASETSQKIIEERNAFFDRLALLNAGALTFSVTLFASLSVKNPRGLVYLHVAWALLLIALAASLLRNLSHQHYRTSHSIASMAEAEINFLDVTLEALSTRVVGYTDSSEPFDKERDIESNRSNRASWEKKLAQWGTSRDRHWAIVRGTEWLAAISMTAGFLFLIIFATVNTRRANVNPPNASTEVRLSSAVLSVNFGEVRHQLRPLPKAIEHLHRS